MNIKETMKSEPEKLINEIKQRVRFVDYREDMNRNDLADYIAAKVKGQISPMLRLARTARRGHYPKWVEFNKLLDYFGMQGILTRENNYSPVPGHVLNHWDSLSSVALDNYIEIFNHVHREEDKLHHQIFEMCFEEWARPALQVAFDRVETEKSDKEIVTYVSKVFFTEYIANRAKSQGLKRKRRGDKWVYYRVEDINDEDFKHQDVLQVIFQLERNNFPTLTEIAAKITRKQTQLLIKLHQYVRQDVEVLSTEQFYEKYPHKRMNYKLVASELGISYDSFVKNIQRIKSKAL
ncbi:hypothetical protein [Sutcliffiella horikoshii]|uniref:hypothetical protein n=1 Tax=Sutcliffiella horikoshii TaxID=79883 RepID=UPI00384DBB12